jgi:AmiR/NasT family two-component response regulator
MGEQEPHDVAQLRSEIQGLREALENRDVIGQAKGMLMERHGISADEAFDRLVRISQDTNVKLHTVAERLVGEGDDGHDHAVDRRMGVH